MTLDGMTEELFDRAFVERIENSAKSTSENYESLINAYRPESEEERLALLEISSYFGREDVPKFMYSVKNLREQFPNLTSPRENASLIKAAASLYFISGISAALDFLKED